NWSPAGCCLSCPAAPLRAAKKRLITSPCIERKSILAGKTDGDILISLSQSRQNLEKRDAWRGGSSVVALVWRDQMIESVGVSQEAAPSDTPVASEESVTQVSQIVTEIPVPEPGETIRIRVAAG